MREFCKHETADGDSEAFAFYKQQNEGIAQDSKMQLYEFQHSNAVILLSSNIWKVLLLVWYFRLYSEIYSLHSTPLQRRNRSHSAAPLRSDPHLC